MPDYFYKVKLEFSSPKNKDRDLSPKFVCNNVVVSLTNIFGEIGGASLPFGLLKFDSNSSELLLSCPEHLAVKLRTALTLQGTYQGENCAYHILSEGRTLLDLCDDQ